MKIIFAIFLLLAELLNSTNAQTVDSSKLLPNSSECGYLNEVYLYNENVTTKPDEFPWMARIAYTKDQKTVYHCQGVLISKRYVISVAHCFIQESFSAYAVVLGDWDTANNITEIDCTKDGRCAPAPKQFDIEEIVVNPNFDSRSSDNDIALLRLDREVVYSAYIRPVCLPTAAAEASQPLVANYYHLAGFGRQIFNEDVGLQKFKTLSHTVSLDRCRARFARVKINDNVVCANCHVSNDLQSSSALMGVRLENFKPKNFYLVGIVSMGHLYCDPKNYMIFVRISSHMDWIKYNMVE